MSIVRRAAALALIAASASGCSSTPACSALETANQPAMFELSCSDTDLVSVTLSGPCSDGDAGVRELAASRSVAIYSPSAGLCHVDMTFATGFTYSADVTFTQETQPGCGDWHYTAPTQRGFTVGNPSSTCVDAGLDVADGGPTDAASAVACPADAGQSVACAAAGTCSGCRYNVKFDCTCADAAEAGGLQWQCIDTGFPCKPAGP